jgi:hypothetical protein
VLLFCIAMDCIHLYYYKKNANNLFFWIFIYIFAIWIV